MTNFIGLIGYPIKHSISPYFQQAALDYYQLDIRYEAWETKPEELELTLARIKEPQNLGANVTIPYKEAVLPLLDEVDNLASVIGAANTIVKREGKLLGFNTDAYGFIQGLRQQGHFEPEGKRVGILGAGGAARAVSLALMRERASSLIVINRTLARAEALVDSLKRYASDVGLEVEIAALPWQSSTWRKTFDRCHLVVNCTSIGTRYGFQEGQSPLSVDVIPRSILVYDLVYNPCPTPLLQLAQRAGANILSGLAMLVYQGAASFELWTGRKAPVDIMLSKAREALRRMP
jgi:shikimate 5-dehydrogenase